MRTLVGDNNSTLQVRWWGPCDLLKQVEQWVSVFKNFEGCHLAFHEATNDIGWWYRERANLSLLASAVVRTGGIAFEEFKGPKNGSTRQYDGRVDAFFDLSGYSYLCEAKHAFLALGGRRAHRCYTTAQAAHEDMHELVPGENISFICGATFLTPTGRTRWSQTKLGSLLVSHRADHYPSVTKLFNQGFRVDLFPDIDPTDTEWTNFVHPGLTVFFGIEPVERTASRSHDAKPPQVPSSQG
jgi:hypothetical protein